MSTKFNSQKHFYFKLFSLVKQFYKQTIPFEYSFFVYTQLNFKQFTLA